MSKQDIFEVLKAWNDGKPVQKKIRDQPGVWVDCEELVLHMAYEYRIKPAEPAEPELEYPVSMIDGGHILCMLDHIQKSPRLLNSADCYQELATWILRENCDNGQIVTRAELDRAVGDRAARDMAVAEAMKSAALDWAGRQLASMPKRLENIDTAAVIASVK